MAVNPFNTSPVRICASFLDWDCTPSSFSGGDEDALLRSYYIWDRARDRARGNPSEFDRTDCIAALRRAINHRLKTLSQAYSFDSLPSLRAGKQTLEKFQDYGLIRPALIRDLLLARNLVEHNDVEPPSAERCRYFTDIVWYFLKSTDGLLRLMLDSINFERDGWRLNLDISPAEKWKVNMLARVAQEMVLPVRGEAFVDLVNGRLVESPGSEFFFESEALFRDQLLTKMARHYFGVAGYWYEDHV